MRVFVTGATGFVGRALCAELVRSGHQVDCLARPGSEKRLADLPTITIKSADLFAPAELSRQMDGCDAVIHLVGIIREFPSRRITFSRLHHEATRSVVSACQQAGVKRYLHMSANGTRKDAVSAYHQTKYLAEEEVRASSLDWTIFRPSLIYGPGDQFITMLVKMLTQLPVMPVIGDGRYQMQPLPVEQVALSFTKALTLPQAIGKTYHCGGADCLSYNQLLDQVAAALGKKSPCKVPQPLMIMRPLVNIFQSLPFFPLTSNQLQMLLEGNCCDTREWLADFNLEAIAMAEGLRYLRQAA